jgi:DNA-binding CsgD family transcriptional regulator
MGSGIDTLTDREKQTLRLIVRGHDAKSAARTLGLSVHTINERLRDARRKLGASSSREAARRLLEAEQDDPQLLGDKGLGDAGMAAGMARDAASAHTGRWTKRRFALIATGVTAMSLILAALLLPASPVNILPVSLTDSIAASSESDAAAAARAAEDFLELVDQRNWAASYAATGTQFRELNTLARWTEVSERVRPQPGELLTRKLTANEFVPAPPQGYQMVKFTSSYANGTSQVETLSLVWEDGAWKVVGIVFD